MKTVTSVVRTSLDKQTKSYYSILFFAGNEVIDQIISVFLSTSMFVGGLVGFVLDNTIPGN